VRSRLQTEIVACDGKLKKVENGKVRNRLQTQIVACEWKVEKS
jgi:hypothetical protein